MRFLPLCAGLALGSGAAWSLRHLQPAAPPASDRPSASAAAGASQPAAGVPLPAPGPLLVLPPLLDETEAGAALEAYLALPPLAKEAPSSEVEERLDRLRALLSLLPSSRFERLFAVLATRVGDAEVRLRRAAFEVWTEHDAPAAARWALAIVPGEPIDAGARQRYLTQAALAWARDDFAAAYAWAGALGDAAAKRSLVPRLLAQLAAFDPDRAVALAQNGDEASVRAARFAIFESWSKRDPAAALRTLGPALLGQNERRWVVQEAFGKWAARDPAAALDWAAVQPVQENGDSRSLLDNLGWNLAQTPGAVRPVLDLLSRRENLPDRSRIIGDIFGSWARNDAPGALAWLGTVSDVAQRSDLVTRALGYMNFDQPDDFLAFVHQLPQSPDREETLASHLSDWAKKDPDAALGWLGRHDADPELAAASRRVEGTLIASLAETDSAAAIARWQALPADASRGEIAAQLAQSWAKKDSPAASRWLAAQLPRSREEAPAMAQLAYQFQTVAAEWTNRDPLGFVAWAQKLPSSYQRDAALDALANYSRYQPYDNNPAEPPPRAAYADQLAQIPDKAIREHALQVHLASWLRSDAQAARAWIEADDNLPPETAARLLTEAGLAL